MNHRIIISIADCVPTEWAYLQSLVGQFLQSSLDFTVGARHIMLVLTLDVKVQFSRSDWCFLASVDVLSSHTDSNVMSVLNAVEELLVAGSLSCSRRVVVDYEVVTEVLGVAVSIFVFDLVDNARHLLNTLVDSTDDAMLAHGFLHFVYCHLQQLLSSHWHSILDCFAHCFHSLSDQLTFDLRVLNCLSHTLLVIAATAILFSLLLFFKILFVAIRESSTSLTLDLLLDHVLDSLRLVFFLLVELETSALDVPIANFSGFSLVDFGEVGLNHLLQVLRWVDLCHL